MTNPNFEDFKKKAKVTMATIADKSVELYKAAEEKTRLLAQKARLKTEVALERGNIRRLYREIGEIYYEIHKDAPEEALAQDCAEVTASYEVIADKLEQIEQLRAKLCFGPDVELIYDDIVPEDIDEAEAAAGDKVYNEPTAETEPDPEAPTSGQYPPEFKM